MSLQDFLIQKFTSWVPASPEVVSRSTRDVTLQLLTEPFGLLQKHLLFKVVRNTKLPPWSVVYSGGKSLKTIDNLAPCNPHQFKVKVILKASAVPKLANTFLDKYGDEDSVYEYFNNLLESKSLSDTSVGNELDKEKSQGNGELTVKDVTDDKSDNKAEENYNILQNNVLSEQTRLEEVSTSCREDAMSDTPAVKPWLESRWSSETWTSTLSDGTSAVCFCMTVRGGYIKQVQMLLDERPALLEIINSNNGLTPLATAVRKGDLAMMRLLLCAGAEVEARGAGGRAALHEAALAARAAAAALLLDRGASLHARDLNGLRAEHCAVDGGSVAVLRLLLDRGGDVTVTDRHGWTPLFRAVVQGAATEMVEELIARGSDVAVVDRAGLTLTAAAALLRNRQCVYGGANGRPRSSLLRRVDPGYSLAAARAHYATLARKIANIQALIKP